MRLSVSLLIPILVYTQLALAQMTSGTISGVVKDASGAVIPGATVSLRNLDTGLVRSLTTDSQGRYQAPNLSLGNYEVQAEVPGFQTAVRRGIQLSVGREAVVDFILNPGTVAEAVTVTAEAPLVETTNAALTGLVDDRAIRDLPLNARSFDQLVLLQVGVIEGRRGGEASFTGGGAKISISGARPTQNSFLLDGTDVNDSRNAMPGSASGALLGVETVREFRVLTNSYSAEYGRAAGGVIIAVTRSGTNELHGSAFEFLRNSALDARNFFDRDPANPTERSDPPSFKRNQFGFTLGGPIKRDRTFFFGSYEGLRERLGLTTRANVPNALAHQGIVPVRGVLTNVGVHPGTRPWLALYPLPNGRDFGDGRGEFVQAVSQSTDQDYFVVRIDHSLSANHSFFSRYTFDDAEKLTPSPLPVEAGSLSSRNQYLTAEVGSILSPTTLNAFRFGYNRSFPKEGTVLSDDFPSGLRFIPDVPFEIGGSVAVSGLRRLGNQRQPRFEEYSLFEWSDDVTLTRGAHVLKTGLLIKRIRMLRLLTNADGGSYSFRSLELFLRGSARQFQAVIPGTQRDRDWRMTYYGFYVQDDFKVTPKLTLNLGLREEFMTSPVETRGLSANLPDIRMTEPRVGNPFFETFKLNLAPRIGFAWDSRGNAKMVLRGGFGLFYDQPFPTYWRSSGSLVPPFSQTAEIANPPWPNAFDFVNPQTAKFGNIRAENYTGTTYAMQYNLTIQSQIAADTALTVGYVGSQGRKITRVGMMNTKVPVILPDGRKFFPANAPRINPVWEDIRIHHRDANSNYNALVLKVDKRFSGGLQVGGSYTFSKTMSIVENVLGGDFAGESQVMDADNPRLDWGQASFSERHNLSINYSYALPIARGGAMGKVFNGWQVNGITRISSGAPNTISSGCCSFQTPGTQFVDRPNLAAGRSNNPVLGGPDQYFDPLAFELPERGFFGNLGRTTLIGSELVNFDFSLVKNTAITEKTNLQFRAELFNLFNRANFGDPATEVFDGAGNRLLDAGRITATDTTARQIQLALKLIF